VLDKVMDRVLSDNSSELIFVYMNPLYTAPFYKKKLIALQKLKTRWYTEAIIFRRPGIQDQVSS
jgi:hypothetical protein